MQGKPFSGGKSPLGDLGVRLLITGGAGFVGSNLAIKFKQKYSGYSVYCLDNLKRRGSELNLPRLKELDIQFIHGDIRCKEDFDAIPEVDAVIEASAEPSVLAGIDGSPDYLINTNLLGTANCLNFAKKHKSDFIFLSTSRVYPIAPLEKLNYKETENRFELTGNQTIPGCSAEGISDEFPLTGYRSLYGATKLASELLIEEYNYFYGLRTVVNRCGVITGPWQMGKVDQGVIVLWAARHFWKQPLSYIGYGGEGKQVRDILDISDLFTLLDLQLNAMDKLNGKTYNVGGGRNVSVSLKELTKICEEVSGNKISISKIAENRQADLRVYITDNSKISADTGWKPSKQANEIVKEIYGWITANESILKNILK